MAVNQNIMNNILNIADDLTKVLSKIARLIDFRDAKSMALEFMGLTHADMNAIEKDYNDSVERNRQIFLKWQKKTGPSKEDLKKLFDDAKEEDIHVNTKIHDVLHKVTPGNNKLQYFNHV